MCIIGTLDGEGVIQKSRSREYLRVGSESGDANLRRKHGISEQTFHRWKARYGGVEVTDGQRLRQLEEENRKVKQLLAQQALDICRIQGGAIEKPVRPQGGREDIKILRDAAK